jgi:hypothetical protein
MSQRPNTACSRRRGRISRAAADAWPLYRQDRKTFRSSFIGGCCGSSVLNLACRCFGRSGRLWRRGRASACRSRAWQPAKKKSRRASSGNRDQFDHVGLGFEALGPRGQRRAVGAVVAADGASRTRVPSPSAVVRRAVGRIAPLLGAGPRAGPRGRSVGAGSFARRYNPRLHLTGPRGLIQFSPRRIAGRLHFRSTPIHPSAVPLGALGNHWSIVSGVQFVAA